MPLLRSLGKKAARPLGLLTGQTTPKSNCFCQENLTEIPFSVENRDTYKPPFKMENSKGKALGAMMLTALAVQPALAEEPNAQVIKVASGVSQQVDCKLLAKNHKGSRAEKRRVYSDCRNGALDAQIAKQEAVIAEQQRVLTALRDQLASLNLTIDPNARILDAQGRELAKIVAINGQLILQRQQLAAQGAETLDRIEAYLRANS